MRCRKSKRAHWTVECDVYFVGLIEKHGYGNWRRILDVDRMYSKFLVTQTNVMLKDHARVLARRANDLGARVRAAQKKKKVTKMVFNVDYLNERRVVNF